ncbi:hypothetical protein BGX34_005392 [Mortierella sp. NVP85]|nr:hypothetical protein BGX34_005392 [Mortierella sp. NVP85]
MSTTPPRAVFDVPELVGLVAQHLPRQDIVHCVATSKSWAHQFEPFLWRDVVLKRSHPAPQTLTLNRHRIRSLSVAANDTDNLRTLAADLPNTPFTGPLQAPYNTTSSTTAENYIFPNLGVIRIHHDSGENDSDWKSLGLEYALRILKQSPGLLTLVAPETILSENESVPSEHTESFLYTLAHKLPCIKELDIRGEGVPLKIGLEFLLVCLNHPQLVNLHCNFGIVGQSDDFNIEDSHQFNAFLSSMEDNKKAKEATGMPALGAPIKSLILPKTCKGYPPAFVCTLLRSYLPNLERLHAPRIHANGDPSLKSSIKKAVAQGCPKLQHLRCSWYKNDGMIQDVINGIVEGCKEWGLKTFYCEDLDDQYRRCILATLSRQHRETLEEVELVNCHSVESFSFVELFLCRNLKRVKIQQSRTGSAAIELQDVKFACRDLRELQLTLEMPYFDKEEYELSEDDFDSDEELDSDDYYERCLEKFEECVKDWAKDAYTEIGSLSKLETLSLNYKKSEWIGFGFDLTLEHGWLRQLAGLKELKHFHMAADFWSKMGQAEVELMDSQWPKLERIEFSCRNLNSIVKKPHWRCVKPRANDGFQFAKWMATTACRIEGTGALSYGCRLLVIHGSSEVEFMDAR